MSLSYLGNAHAEVKKKKKLRKHNKEMASASTSAANVCPCCGHWCASTMKDLFHHIKLYHSDEPNFSIQCCWHDCIRTFRNFHTFRNHVYIYHCLEEIQEYPLPPTYPDVNDHEETSSLSMSESDIDQELENGSVTGCE